MGMKFKVVYQQLKKKSFKNQEAVFYDERDAINWEHYVRTLDNTRNIEIHPVFWYNEHERKTPFHLWV